MAQLAASGCFGLTEAGEAGLELCDAGETGLDREGETSPEEVSAEELRREARSSSETSPATMTAPPMVMMRQPTSASVLCWSVM
jgi:hypothetical protein